jgi:site-specific DNA recombinase
MGPSRRREHAKRPRLCSRESFDDRGNRMSPSWARKGSKRWRYYVSQAALQGDKSKAGSIVRVPAAYVEAFVADAVTKRSSNRAASQVDIRNLIDRVAIGRTAIQVLLSEAAEVEEGARTLAVPWSPPSPYRKREIIQGANDANAGARPMRANARAILIDALGDAHRWLDELLSERSIRMTLSLAFVAPDIVKAAVEGRLPRGLGLKRLVELGQTNGGRSGSKRRLTHRHRSVLWSALSALTFAAIGPCNRATPTLGEHQLWKRKFAA